MSTQPGTTRGAFDWRQPQPVELPPILVGARAVFHERGYHGASVRDIAQRIGVTVPTLYYHYENKQAILVALLELNMAWVLDGARGALKDGGDVPERRFAYLIEAVVVHLTHDVGGSSLDSELRYLEPANRQRYAAMRKQLQDSLLTTIEDGVATGVFDVPAPAVTARALLGMCQAVTTWFHPEGPQSPAEIAQRYVEIALKSVGYRPENSALGLVLPAPLGVQSG